jgi:4-nitrophenyl phosphatase
MKFSQPENESIIAPEALILDMDGTLLQGAEPLPGLQNLFTFLQGRQMPFIIATNNATKSPRDYQQKLAQHGVEISENRILTAGVATALYLQKELKPGAKIYMIGQSALKSALLEAGFKLIPDATEDVTAVVVGGDSNLTYEKLKNATLLLQRGAQFIGTNPDVVYPTEEGFIPETGATLAALQAATGVKSTVIGKPEPYLFDLAITRLGSDPAQTAVIGDRLETDILGGHRAGLKTILTTTGIDNETTILEKNIHPDWVVYGLDDLVNRLSKSALSA